MKKIEEFILNFIEKKHDLSNLSDVQNINYLDMGFIDSIELTVFIVEIENQFNIELTHSDMLQADFRTIGGLTSLINKKITNENS